MQNKINVVVRQNPGNCLVIPCISRRIEELFIISQVFSSLPEQAFFTCSGKSYIQYTLFRRTFLQELRIHQI